MLRSVYYKFTTALTVVYVGRLRYFVSKQKFDLVLIINRISINASVKRRLYCY